MVQLSCLLLAQSASHREGAGERGPTATALARIEALAYVRAVQESVFVSLLLAGPQVSVCSHQVSRQLVRHSAQLRSDRSFSQAVLDSTHSLTHLHLKICAEPLGGQLSRGDLAERFVGLLGQGLHSAPTVTQIDRQTDRGGSVPGGCVPQEQLRGILHEGDQTSQIHCPTADINKGGGLSTYTTSKQRTLSHLDGPFPVRSFRRVLKKFSSVNIPIWNSSSIMRI